jgi:hypothetical protein
MQSAQTDGRLEDRGGQPRSDELRMLELPDTT